MSSVPTYKVILVGNGGVGKTVFLNRFINNEFEQKYIATLGVEIHPCRIGTFENPHAIFNVWDCAGQEKFGGLRDGYYVGAQAVICMFDFTSKISFESIKKLLIDVERVTGYIPFILVGAKSDLPSFMPREIIRETMGIFQYVEISSETGKGVSEVFETLLSLLQTQ